MELRFILNVDTEFHVIAMIQVDKKVSLGEIGQEVHLSYESAR